MSWQRQITLAPLDRLGHLGVPLVRAFLGAVLISGTADNVLSAHRTHEFRDFLAANGFPYPLLCACLSAWAQFVAGWMIVLGVATRVAAAVMIVTFTVALVMVHRALPFGANIAPLAMWFGSLLLLLHGAGRYSIDARLARVREPDPRRRPRAV